MSSLPKFILHHAFASLKFRKAFQADDLGRYIKEIRELSNGLT